MQHSTRTFTSIATAATLSLGALTLAAGPANAAEPAPVTQAAPAHAQSAIITGPLINGPLIDLGGLLNDLRIGQFQ